MLAVGPKGRVFSGVIIQEAILSLARSRANLMCTDPPSHCHSSVRKGHLLGLACTGRFLPLVRGAFPREAALVPCLVLPAPCPRGHSHASNPQHPALAPSPPHMDLLRVQLCCTQRAGMLASHVS